MKKAVAAEISFCDHNFWLLQGIVGLLGVEWKMLNPGKENKGVTRCTNPELLPL